jgi:8-oxo-dGTP diphosphatase
MSLRNEEQAFLAEYDPAAFERPSVAVDVVVLTVAEGQLWAVLRPRERHPHVGRWALPGGFVGVDESLDDAAARLLRTKAGLEGVFLEQLYTFGSPDRDPRMRIITVAYYALVPVERLAGVNGGAVLAPIDVPWQGEQGGPVEPRDLDDQLLELAFDHADILGLAVQRIRGKLGYTDIGFALLPPSFTLRQLRLVHESILGAPLNKDSFRRRLLASGDLEATGERQADVGHRPAALYRFTRA